MAVKIKGGENHVKGKRSSFAFATVIVSNFGHQYKDNKLDSHSGQAQMTFK